MAEAVRTGRLKKPDRCERCGEKVAKPKLQGHHDDYSKRLDVRWLCTKCHPIEDKARRECEARGRKASAPSRRSEIKHTGKAGSADAPKRGP